MSKLLLTFLAVGTLIHLQPKLANAELNYGSTCAGIPIEKMGCTSKWYDSEMEPLIVKKCYNGNFLTRTSYKLSYPQADTTSESTTAEVYSCTTKVKMYYSNVTYSEKKIPGTKADHSDDKVVLTRSLDFENRNMNGGNLQEKHHSDSTTTNGMFPDVNFPKSLHPFAKYQCTATKIFYAASNPLYSNFTTDKLTVTGEMYANEFIDDPAKYTLTDKFM